MRTSAPTGTLGEGTALIPPAKRSQSSLPITIPRGMPTAVPMATATVDWLATVRPS